ncbi:F-box domain containing protein, partial [Parasponia andersonii]
MEELLVFGLVLRHREIFASISLHLISKTLHEHQSSQDVAVISFLEEETLCLWSIRITAERTMENLRREIIVDVLSRLTVKDLLRYRKVCKAWRSLIDGPDFIKIHLDRSKKTNSNNGIVLTGRDLYWVDSGSLDSAVRLDPPLDSKKGIDVGGSCNGLLALVNTKGDMAFWNPSTRRYRGLPISSLECPSGFGLYKLKMIGFGYDPINDDHKLLRMVNFSSVESDEYFFQSHAGVYSLRAKTWKRIKDFPCLLIPHHVCGVSFCNALHWVATRKSGTCEFSDSVFAYDLVTEDCRELSLPDYTKNCGICTMKVVELGDWLCVVGNFKREDEKAVLVEIWAMKEYGVKESWTKLFSVVPSNHVTGPFGYLIPLAYFKGSDDDKVLLNVDGEKFLLYDMKGRRIQSVTILGCPRSFDHTSVSCVESLVGVDGGYEEINTKKQAGENRNKKEKQQPRK